LPIYVITNNPAVAARYPDISRYYNCSVHKILTTVRDEVHKGAQIITHPLSGSIKPNESPYKSVVISATGNTLDYKSLQIIEDAIITLSKLPIKQQVYDESVLEDFRIIDLDLIKESIVQCQKFMTS